MSHRSGWNFTLTLLLFHPFNEGVVLVAAVEVGLIGSHVGCREFIIAGVRWG